MIGFEQISNINSMRNKARISAIQTPRIVTLNPQYKNGKIKDRIGISTSDGIEVIKHSDISYCQAEGNYCTIYSRSGREVLASKTLKVMQAALNENTFLRVHQSYVVCLADIQKVSKKYIILENGKSIPVSRARRSFLLDRLHEVTNIL